MKLTKPILLVTVILLGCASCKNKAGNTEQESAKPGTEEINDSVYHAQGVVMDQDIALEEGLSVGDTLEVSYTVTEDEPGINIASAITKIH